MAIQPIIRKKYPHEYMKRLGDFNFNFSQTYNEVTMFNRFYSIAKKAVKKSNSNVLTYKENENLLVVNLPEM